MRKEIQLHGTDKWKSLIPISFILTWSSGAIFVKLGLQYANPFTFVFLRFLLSTTLLWMICLAIRSTFPKTVKEWGYIILTGLLLQAGYQIFYFFALEYQLSPGVLAIILGAQPVITAFFGDLETKYDQWLGLFLGLSGLVLVVVDHISAPNFTLFGLLSALICLGSITIGTFMQKRIQLSQPMNMAIQYSGGLLVILIFLPFFGGWQVEWSPAFLMSLSWMAFVVSVGASMMLYFMIQKGDLTNVTSLLYAVPPVTALLDYAVFQNQLSWIAGLGMILIMIGLFLIQRRGKIL
ncbi:DMT family transporter [Lihuaxuella thermophila]|uniref:Permease of the drug/metabolite transporter (DMT) superfamily n=1 Tax=Lihuaxuella thermophila TaxID=1173111 RepID=A0A1H8FKG7_9BACL|nr:DMT family transporter [Lihuaxuella thermophila]SEN32004.1 Permease of the drug/metabolite transporter (DMT) superfamily [Lihuaxuella thermophila]